MLSYNTYEPTHDPLEVVAWCPLGPRSPDDLGADPSRHRGQERIGRACAAAPLVASAAATIRDRCTGSRNDAAVPADDGGARAAST
jgi:hypothetical protein